MGSPGFPYFLFILINYSIVLIFVTVSIFTSPKPIIVTDGLDLLSFAAVFSTIRSMKKDYTGFLCLLSVIFNILACTSSSLSINRILYLTANQVYNGTVLIGNGQINRIATYPTVDLFWFNSLKGMYVITSLTTASMIFIEISTVIFLTGKCCKREKNPSHDKFNRIGSCWFRKLSFWPEKNRLFRINIICIALVVILHISITITSYIFGIPGWSSIESPHLLLLTSFAIFLSGQRYWITANVILIGGLILSWWSFTLDYQRIEGIIQWITVPAVENHFTCVDGGSFGPYVDYQCVITSSTIVPNQVSSIIVAHQLCQLFIPLFGSTLFLMNIITMIKHLLVPGGVGH